MTEERAIQVIKNVIKCMMRSARGCDKKCDKCNLGISTNEVLAAYDLAIKALAERNK